MNIDDSKEMLRMYLNNLPGTMRKDEGILLKSDYRGRYNRLMGRYDVVKGRSSVFGRVSYAYEPLGETFLDLTFEV